MEELSRKDKLWSWILLICPIGILAASAIPGIMEVFYWDARFYTGCSLFTMPGETDMSGIRIMLFLAMGYWVVTGCLYCKLHSRGPLIIYTVLSGICTVLFALGLTLDGTHLHPLIKPFPYGLLPALCLVVTVLSLVCLIKMKKRETD